MIQILGLMGMYFDVVVVEVKTFLLLFRLAMAILCPQILDIVKRTKRGNLSLLVPPGFKFLSRPLSLPRF